MDIQEKYLEKLKNGLGQLEISYTEEMIAALDFLDAATAAPSEICLAD